MALDAPRCPRSRILDYPQRKRRSEGEAIVWTGQREAGRELDRTVFFSDAVFTIAITILVLDIRVPDIQEGRVAMELPAQILGLGPKYLSCVISFLVLAVYWQAHHRVFRPFRSYDGTLVWLNFLFLMAVAFLPFPTSLLGEYSGEQVSVV
jgi:uncharacterized membrane protein